MKSRAGHAHDVVAEGANQAVSNSPGKSFGEVFSEKKSQLDSLQANLAAAIMPSIPGQSAGKFYDISIGIDFHATSFPPSPMLPVPNVSMVFDMFTMLFVAIKAIMPPDPLQPPQPPPAEGEELEPQPITVSSVARAIVNMMQPSVQVNNQWIANAGCSIQHLPGIFVHLPFPIVAPMAEGEMFMGSSTVLADGAPFSYQFLPALSCNLVGMPAPFRAKKLGKPKLSLMAPTSSLIAVLPKGKPVLVGGPPTIDLFALAMKLGLKGMGKLWKKGGDKLFKKLDNKFPNTAKKLKPVKCFLFGEPVDVATGRVYAESTDFSFQGPIPLEWNRFYFSDDDRITPLGRGWHHSYDVYHSAPREDAIEVKLPDGRYVVMPVLLPGTSFYHPIEKATWRFDGSAYTLQPDNGLHYQFAPVYQEMPLYKLSSVSNDNGHTIALKYDYRQRLTTIVDSVGRIFSLTYSSEDRLERIVLLHEDYRPIWHHRYTYNDELLLEKVVDVQGAEKYFEYKDSLLIHLKNQLGLNFYWEYEGKGTRAKCIHTWGDEGILEYHTTYEKGKTTVTNSLGHVTRYFYNEDLLVTKIIDPLGHTTIHQYNHLQEKVMTIDPMGHSTKYAYDGRSNLVSIEDPKGNKQGFAYDEHDRLVSSTSAEGATFAREFDAQGNVTRLQYPNGSTLELHYADGKLHEIIDQEEQTTLLEWDTQHNLRKITAPNGAVSEMQYDFFGQLLRATAPNGTTTTYEYDKVGNVLKLTEPAGNVHRFTYDHAGNVLTAQDNRRQVTFTYWGLGQLKSRVENGRAVRFAYDTEQQLKTIRNERNEVYRFVHDGNGDIIGEYGFDGLSRHYTRNANGQVTHTQNPEYGTTRYEYDSLGQLTTAYYSDDTYEYYAYDKDGRVIEATNAHSQVRLERNKAGAVTAEIQNGHRIESSYNSFGQRTLIASSLGAHIAHTYNELGQLTHSMAQQGKSPAWQAQFAYNSMGQEIERSLSGVTLATGYDQAGRVKQQLIHHKNPELSTRRQYQWSPGNQLLQLIHNGQATTFDYDALNNLSGATYTATEEKVYKLPDALGNLYKTRDKAGYEYSAGGKLIEDPDYTYTYNREGFLIEKKAKRQNTSFFNLLLDADGNEPKTTWHYEWYANGHLKKAYNNEGVMTEHTYDALGRRLEKIVGHSTVNRYIYDGNVLLHEWQYAVREKPRLVVSPEGALSYDKPEPIEDLTTWVFDEETFVPSAKITKEGTCSIISDHLGTPIEAYNEAGKKVWERELDIYGNVRRGDNIFCPWLYQNQYYDQETGLAYNRFRYYDPGTGSYISQDPIGLEGNNPNLYAYTYNSNSQIDVFGLSHSKSSSLLYNIIDQSSFGGTTSEMKGIHKYEDIMEAGRKFVGKNSKIETFFDGKIKSMVSNNGLKRFRPPIFKPLQGYKQANFEMRTNTGVSWNAYIYIDDGKQKVKNPNVSNMHVKSHNH